MKSIFYWFLLSVPCFSSIALAQEKDTSAVVISGGISLGVYEAGLNHVIVKTMNSEHKYLIPSKMDVKKLPKMNVTTGSSAGAINSIASAISSCIKYDKYSQTLFDNIFRDIWIGVGLDNLMPVDYSKYDGLSLGGVSANNEKQKIVDSIFSRTVFEEPIDKLRNMFETGQAKKDCNIIVGIMVTLARPNEIQLELNNNTSATIREQSYAIPIRLISVPDIDGAYRLAFEALSDEELPWSLIDTSNRKYIQLPSHAGRIPFDSVIRAGLASSAFPGAFGPITLNYCFYDKAQTAKKYCHKDNALKGMFIDGGYFNNIPIGLAAELMSTFNERGDIGSFVFIDPDNTNRPSDPKEYEQQSNLTEAQKLEKEQKEQKETSLTLMNQLKNILPGIGTLRKRDLQNDLNLYFAVNKKSQRSYSPTVRNPYLTGNFLGAFGAFFDPSFREYDYVAGVYDGMRFVSQQLCADELSDNIKTKCEVDTFRQVLSQVTEGVSTSKESELIYLRDFNALVGAFLNDDFASCVNAQKCSEENSPWLEVINSLYDKNYSSKTYLVFLAIHETGDKKIDDFLNNYTAEYISYRDGKDSSIMVSDQLNYMMFRRDFWRTLIVKRATQRLIYLERENRGGFNKLLSGAYILIPPDSFASENIGNVRPHDQSSLLISLAPDQFGLDAVQTGIVVAWSQEPNFRATGTYNGNFEFGMSLHMQIKDKSDDRVDFVNAWVGTRFHRPSTFYSSWGGSLSVNRNISNTDNFGNKVLLGGEINFGFLSDKIRFSIGTRDILSDYGGEDWSVKLMFTNIDDLIWAFK
ncbi:patatin-like phospholipase family protein [Pseudoalteromonas tunicata]|nr:patatin-like phospholipase family protein [Pseudoalteromonas tunicata]ATC93832.1 hypothetical protein PTUN_a1162 [Pseudoalteromonas tunicata]